MEVNIFLVNAEFFADVLIIHSILHQRNQRPEYRKKGEEYAAN
jgi:hypothetical protein